jgi:hypothetical protein
MQKFYVTFRFHLKVNDIKSTGLPRQIDRTETMDAESIGHLAFEVTKMLSATMKLGGGVWDKNPLVKKKGILLPGVTKELDGFDMGIFIPAHMIAYIETITTPVPQPNPEESEFVPII